MTEGAPSQILSYSDVCEGVGFNRYWDEEEKYKYNEAGLINGYHENGTQVNGSH
jgi:hypothetical protein